MYAGEILPTLMLLLHFRRISQPAFSPPRKEPRQSADNLHHSPPTRPEDACVDFTSSDSDSDDNSSDEGFAVEGAGKQPVFDDINRYDLYLQ